MADIQCQNNLPNEAKQTKAANTRKKRTARSYALSLLIKIGITALALWILLYFFVGIYVCHDNSGYPMVKDGDLCVIWRREPIRQGDVVVYTHEGVTRFGRVAAQAGGVVDIAGGYVTVDGSTPAGQTVYPTTSQGAAVSFPYEVPDDCIFVLCDYRETPDDSRILGGIPLREVEGSVILLMRRRGI